MACIRLLGVILHVRLCDSPELVSLVHVVSFRDMVEVVFLPLSVTSCIFFK